MAFQPSPITFLIESFDVAHRYRRRVGRRSLVGPGMPFSRKSIFFCSSSVPSRLVPTRLPTKLAASSARAASNPTWSALYSQAIRERQENLPVLLLRLTRLIALAIGPLAAVLAAAAPQLFEEVLGAKWNGAAPILQVLAPSFALASAASLVGAIFLATNRNGAFLKTFAFLSVGRVFAVGLGHWLGISGTIYALAIVHLAYAAIVYAVCRKLFALSLQDLLDNTVGPPRRCIRCILRLFSDGNTGAGSPGLHRTGHPSSAA